MKDLIKGKIFPFSCRDVGATFLGAMITAGAQFVTANNGLAINTLNDWCAYLKDIILSNTELIASFNTLLSSKNWVYKADGPGPFYVFPPVAIHPSQTGKSLQDGLTIVCYQGRVALSCNSPAGAFHFSVFTLSGKEIYSTILSTPETVWNMNTTNGKPVLPGPYVFVLKNNGKNVKKRVMLFR